MAEIQNVSGTAFIIAEFRAAENAAPEPLYHDPIVQLFLDQQTQQIADQVSRSFPLAKQMVKLRTRYFDDVLTQQIAAGCQQVVILGSGLDTRAVRMPAAGVKYFEIDQEATLNLKAERLSAHGIAANVTYIAGDYVKDNLTTMLCENQFDFDLPSYFLWEGNVTYLKRGDIVAVLEQIRQVKHWTLSLDYLSDQVIEKTTEYADLNDYVTQLERLGAPWITGFSNITLFAETLRLATIEDIATAELHYRYYPQLPLPSALLQFYFVCTVQQFPSNQHDA